MPDDMPLDVEVRTPEKRMRWIVSSQLDNGSWFDDIEMTIAAILSVMRSPEHLQDVDIEAGIEWLKQNMDVINDVVPSYVFEHLWAEYYLNPIPECPFDLSFTENQLYSEHDAGNLDELRCVAILRGNVVKIFPGGGGFNQFGATYTPLEIMWMSVGEPLSES